MALFIGLEILLVDVVVESLVGYRAQTRDVSVVPSGKLGRLTTGMVDSNGKARLGKVRHSA